jgi:sulfite exporter TauE/SafE
MTNEVFILVSTAMSIGFIHTIIGVDHYLPFIVIAHAKKWTKFKTAWIVIICGIGHILSSVALGFIGIATGTALSYLVHIESVRGEIAAWLLIGFGLVYTLWGIKQSYKNKSHTHTHFHEDGSLHTHEHKHRLEHSHIHEKKANITPWVIFLIFAFGPCEPLIPLVMYPAAQHNYFAVILVSAVFGIVTILTMLSMTFAGYLGFKLFDFSRFEKHAHTLAGIVILICGLGIKFLGM